MWERDLGLRMDEVKVAHVPTCESGAEGRAALGTAKLESDFAAVPIRCSDLPRPPPTEVTDFQHRLFVFAKYRTRYPRIPGKILRQQTSLIVVPQSDLDLARTKSSLILFHPRLSYVQ